MGQLLRKPFEVDECAARKVHYADRFELEQEILQRGCAYGMCHHDPCSELFTLRFFLTQRKEIITKTTYGF